MASNVLPGVSTAWRGGSAPWGRRHLPLSPAAQVGGADHTLAHASPEGSESATSVDSIPPYNAAVAAAAAAAIGSSHLQQQPMYLPPNPYFPNANGVVGSPTETSNDRGSVVGNSHDHHCNALRLILLEAEVKSAKTHNLHLQHNMAFLQTQNSGQLGHIASLHAKIRALESELTSLKATNEVVGANSAPATSVPPNTTPPSAPAPAVLGPPLPDQHQPVPHGPAKPGISGNDDLWDLRPKSSCGSVAASGAATEAATEAEPGGSSAAPSGSAAAALLVVSPENQISPAAAATEGIPSAFNDTQVTRSGDSTTTESSSAGPAVAQGENDSSSNDGSAESGGCVETELGVGVNTAPVVTTPKRTRNSLKDFWADSNLNIDDSPPASNTRNHRHRAAAGGSPQRTVGASSSPTGQVASHGASADTEIKSEPAQGAADPSHVGDTTAARSGEDAPATVAEPAARTQSQAVLAPVLRRTTEGREGADDRSSHLMDCAFCEETLPESDSIGRCEKCPRSYCTQCLERGLHEQGVGVEGLDRGCRALLHGEKGDFFIAQCPLCIRGGDKEFAPPPEGAVPMDHLLDELLRHDLSLCFREPVDIIKHPDYLESIGRKNMMDLGTMLGKLKSKRYPRRRGPGQFLEDLNRIWRNCRRFAGCDELGRPHYGTTVPGIVRCAITLEAMSIKFCATYMSEQGTAGWQESTWDFHRQRQERENAEARLKSLENTADTVEVTPRAPDGGGVGLAAAVGQDCRGITAGGVGSNSSGSISENLAEEESEKLGDDRGNGSSSARHHAATESSATGGRKRKAAAKGGSVHNRRIRAAARIVPGTTVLGTTAASSAQDGGGVTPTIVRRPAGKTQQQPPWSPLDKLCDLATTFKKDALTS